MKKIFVPMLILLSAPALAAKLKNAQCSDMATINADVAPRYLAVIDGYDTYGKRVSQEIDMGGIVTESKKVNEQCIKDRSAKIAALRKDIKTTEMNPTRTSATLNPVNAQCKDFIALGEEVQPVAVFWVAGHSKSGKLTTGVVDEEFLARPIGSLVEECKSKPTASFYDETKAWFRKHL